MIWNLTVRMFGNKTMMIAVLLGKDSEDMMLSQLHMREGSTEPSLFKVYLYVRLQLRLWFLLLLVIIKKAKEVGGQVVGCAHGGQGKRER
jgi:hypothetical protein